MVRKSLLVVILVTLVYLYSKKDIKEGFKVENPQDKQLDRIKFGSLNRDYEEFIKGNIVLFDLPLPLDSVRPPYLNSSDKTRAELEDIQEKMKTLDKDMIKAIQLYDDNLHEVIIDFCKRENLKYDPKYIEILLRDVAIIALRMKKIYNRPRPSQLGRYWGVEIHPLKSDNIDCPSYPSGSTLQTSMVGHVLKNLNPSQTAVIDQFVQEIAKSRVSAGFNYQSDVDMSIQTADILKKYIKYFELKAQK